MQSMVRGGEACFCLKLHAHIIRQYSIVLYICGMTDYNKIIGDIYREMTPLWGSGKVADYIPALAEVDPRQLGIVVDTVDDMQSYRIGDADIPFSIQSISKVFTLAMVISTPAKIFGNQ